MSVATAEKAAKDLLAAYRQSIDKDGMYEVATKRRWRHSICSSSLCGCPKYRKGVSRRYNIHARDHECHPRGCDV